jgi:hypothetical protein
VRGAREDELNRTVDFTTAHLNRSRAHRHKAGLVVGARYDCPGLLKRRRGALDLAERRNHGCRSGAIGAESELEEGTEWKFAQLRRQRGVQDFGHEGLKNLTGCRVVECRAESVVSIERPSHGIPPLPSGTQLCGA